MAPFSLVYTLSLFLLPLSAPTNSIEPHSKSKHHSESKTDPETNTLLNPSSLKSLCECESTPFPSTCLASINVSIPVNLQTNIFSVVLQSLLSAISTVSSVSSLLSTASHYPYLIASQQGPLQDCQDLHESTLYSLSYASSLVKSNSPDKYLPDIRAHLSAAMTNKVTCLDGLDESHGPMKQRLVSSIISAYQPVSNALSLVSKGEPTTTKKGRKLSTVNFPTWLSRRDRKLLQSNDNGDGTTNGFIRYDSSSTITVAKDGSGNFTKIGDAIAFASNNSDNRIIITIKAGIYEENIFIDKHKTNIVLMGGGKDVTVITGSRSIVGGWKTFRSATVAVEGHGFLARDITFRNTAGPSMDQAVALRVSADKSAIYRCIIDGYQDTLYVHSYRQFYHECDIYGTVDFIFGNAAVVLQGCNIIVRKPNPGQSNVITAQSRNCSNEDTGIAIRNCSIIASQDLASSNIHIKTYLGRPWKNYSRTVYVESFIDGLVDPAGWAEWPGRRLDMLYYGEYMNRGPGSSTDKRVTWPGYHVMGYDEATYFSVSKFIYGDAWLGSTSFLFDNKI